MINPYKSPKLSKSDNKYKPPLIDWCGVIFVVLSIYVLPVLVFVIGYKMGCLILLMLKTLLQ